MIDAVLLFGVMNVLFEFVLLCMLRPRLRLRVLGSEGAKVSMHLCFLCINLVIHWGTVVGTMSAVFAFISSLVTVQIAIWVFGFIRGTHYTTGLIRFKREELV